MRSAIENDVYSLLRDSPEMRASAVADPKAFLADRLKFDIGGDRVTVREEASDELLLILPNVEAREELNDAALDMVAGGGDSGCQSGAATHKYDSYGEG